MSTAHARRDRAIEHEIMPALGDFAADYDLGGMADELLEWHTERTPEGEEIVTDGVAGFRLRQDVDFWEVAGRYDLSAALERVSKEAQRAVVVRAVAAGMTRSRVSDLTGISRPTINSWIKAAHVE